jgi:hypothetical protein
LELPRIDRPIVGLPLAKTTNGYNFDKHTTLAPMSHAEFWTWVSLLAVAILAGTTWSARKSAAFGGFNRFSVLFAIFYIGCCGISVGLGIAAHRTQVGAEGLLRPSTVKAIDAQWRSNLPASDRTRLSKALAQSLYVSSGTISSFINDKGELAPFQPSDLERTERSQVLLKAEQGAAFAKQALIAAILWLLVPLAGLAISVGNVHRKHL